MAAGVPGDDEEGSRTRDLSLIATTQLVCLAAGVFIVWSERPLAVVYVACNTRAGSETSVASRQPDPTPAFDPLTHPNSFPNGSCMTAQSIAGGSWP